jgi:hypothetical protein
MSDLDRGWLAGLIEGEGHIGLRAARGGRPALTVAMVDEDVVRRCQEVTGVGTIHHKPAQSAERQDVWVWRVSAVRTVASVLTAIAPLMGARRRARVEVALSQAG